MHGAGSYLSESAYGHTGFTGTSIWIDPDREMFVILLTNRVHAARAKRPAKVIADVRADLADAAALAVTDANLAVAEMPASFRADREVGWNRALRAARSARRKGILKKPAASVKNASAAPKVVKAKKKSPPTNAARKKVAAKTATAKKPRDTSKD